VTHPGIPGLRRGHALRVFLPESGSKDIVYVKDVTHSVSPGGYDMEVTCSFEDPFVAQDERIALLKKCAAAKRRGRKPPADCPGTKKEPKPRTAAQRADVAGADPATGAAA
jgi:hypothetical protein